MKPSLNPALQLADALDAATPSRRCDLAPEAAMTLRAQHAQIAALKRALDNRVPIDRVSELHWRIAELEAQLADARA
jgi:hypothetical protein